MATKNATTTAEQPPIPPRPSSYANNSFNTGMQRFPYSMMSSFAPTASYGLGFGGYGNYGSYGSPYGNAYPYGGGSYGGYGGYGAYGHPASTPLPESDVIRAAEERSRAAFQSIESFIQAFQSISMMLDSSYWALASSFRAVLSVAEHFSRLRFQLGTALASVAGIRTLLHLIRVLLRFLGLEGLLPALPSSEEQAWRNAKGATNIDNEQSSAPLLLNPAELMVDAASNKSNWPILAFFSVAFGIPIVIYKLVQSVATEQQDVTAHGWSNGLGEHYVAYANFNFQGDKRHAYNGHQELSFKHGEKLLIAPKELQGATKGWLLASRKGRIGLVPYTYLSQPYKVIGEAPAPNFDMNKAQKNIQSEDSSS